ncbi:MAG TPA: phosphotransferase, partial [Phycisphaerae bacterium]
MELTPENAIDYLRQAERASITGEILVQALPGDERPGGNVVLKIFDTTAGEKIGTDLRTEVQKKLGKPDLRPTQGNCFVLKQPRPAAMGGIDLGRISSERACMDLLGNLLPEHSVPAVQWYDEAAGILAMSCAPLDAVVWRKQLGAGVISMDAATHTGMLLAMLHSSTKKDMAVKEKFGDSRVLLQGRLDPAIRAASSRNVPLMRMLQDAAFRVKSPLCLIHGDYSTENILLVPAPAEETPAGKAKSAPGVSQAMIVDFETACFGHNAFDVATIVSD